MNATKLFYEILETKSLKEIADILSLHIGTVKRWYSKKAVPNNYHNDLNSILNNKYPAKEEYRDKDQFYTSKKTAIYCYQKTLEVLITIYCWLMKKKSF